MKLSQQISAGRITASLMSWLAATNVLVGLAYLTGWWPLKVALFVCITFLPGVVLLRLMRIVLRNASVAVLYSFGLSLLVLMLSGLVANQVLYLFVSRPLGIWGVLGTWDVVTMLLILWSKRKNHQTVLIGKWPWVRLSRHAKLLMTLSLLLPCIAALGAFQLNNGGGPLLAELTLCYAATLIMYTFVLRHQLSDGLLAWFVFIVGLTILLMTSLRGWDIVGHDIEREFRVYTLTHMHEHWNIGLDRSPYNACLSITILPEMFAKLLNVSGLVVFKVILQVIFAACPAVIYVLLRQYASKMAALVGSLLFICYPTFINDSAMLTRQGIAYLFFALALLVISNRTQRKRYRLLFLLCSLGTILSHYSTSYIFVALFAIAVICKYAVIWWRIRRGKRQQTRQRSSVLSPLIAGLLFFMTFMWYAQITATSGGVMTTLHASFANIPKLFSGDNRSSDTSSVLLFGNKRSQAELYQSYEVSSQSKKLAPVVGAAQYFPTLTSDQLPLTKLGKTASTHGVDPSLITTLRQNFAKVLQMLAVLSVVYAVYRLLRRRPGALDVDFICLNVAGLILLALMVVLPVLSVNYGILRAFQQMLIFLILPITLLLVQVGRRLWSWARIPVMSLSVVLLFLLFTGLFAQILGGVSPTLSLDNSGIYYGLYNSPAADIQSFVWLKTNVAKGTDVRAANFNRAAMHDPSYPFSKAGILPSQLSPSSIVYLDPTQTQAKRLYTYYDSSPLTLTFPFDYYGLAKNQIYSTTTTGVYK